jgi:hypothetical protein
MKSKNQVKDISFSAKGRTLISERAAPTMAFIIL